MSYLKVVSVDKPKKIPKTYKFYPETIKKLEKISKQQGESMTTVIEYLVNNFDNLELKKEYKKTNVK
jgi:hypothetical protein